MKSGFIAIVGRPSAGKSTLMNTFCGEKVAITSPVPQTTRNKIRGIMNDEKGQIVFTDTPGFHNSDKKMNIYLKDLVYSTLEESEAILYIVDSTRPPGKEEQEIIAFLSRQEVPLIVGINKIDTHPDNLDMLRGALKMNVQAENYINISATEKKGIDELKEVLFNALPDGPPMYPEDFYTDQDPVFRITEIIREKAIMKTSEELPHALYVEVADTEWRGDKSKRLWVRAFLTVERDSQKGIVIGRGGEKIREIRKEALYDINHIFPYKVQLDLRVKVNPKWRQKDYLLKGMLK